MLGGMNRRRIGAGVVVVGAVIALAVWRWPRDAARTEGTGAAGARVGASSDGETRGARREAGGKRPQGEAEASAEALAFPVRPVAGVDEAVYGALEGRVLNWSTGEPVPDAELTFAVGDEADSVKTDGNGRFRLAPGRAGHHRLATITKVGFLPYAPDWRESPVELALAARQRVAGLTFYLFPAVDYHGRVVDEKMKPVAGATVKLLGAPGGEQRLESLETQWTSDAQGQFVAHAADDAIFEATFGAKRGRQRLDGGVALTHEFTIQISAGDQRKSVALDGFVRDPEGNPVPGVVVHAQATEDPLAAPLIAVSGADGGFGFTDASPEPMLVRAEAEGQPPVEGLVTPGKEPIVLIVEPGVAVAGRVIGTDGQPVPAATVIVVRREGVVDRFVTTRSVLDPRGAFELRLKAGEYRIHATAPGRAPGEPQDVTIADGARPLTLSVPDGGSVSGTVRASTDKAPIPYARVMLEAPWIGASALPANPGTVTGDDGAFLLTGLPPGRATLTLGAGNHHPRLLGGLVIEDGKTLGPLEVLLTPLQPGEEPKLELAGIGVKISPAEAALQIDGVIPGGGAEAAGLTAGDQILAVDGAPVAQLGMQGAITRLRGAEGTTVALRVRKKAGGEGDVVVERRRMRA